MTERGLKQHNSFMFYGVIAFVALFPFYIFPSGLPQPSHLIFVAFVLLSLQSQILIPSIRDASVGRMYLYFSLFLALIIVVIFRDVMAAIQWQTYRPLLYPGYYLFGFLFALSCFHLLVHDQEKFSTGIVRVLFFVGSVLIVFLAAGVGREWGGRSVLFFNNPNQLGYYALLTLSLLSMLYDKTNLPKLVLVLTFGIFFILVLASLSRAAIVGSVFVFMYIVLKQSLVTKMAVFFLASVLAGCIAGFYTEEVLLVLEALRFLESSDVGGSGAASGFWYERGYYLIFSDETNLILGNGSGYKFSGFHNEVHSIYAAFLIAYGMVGFVLLACMLLITFKISRWHIFLLIIPIIIYGALHNGSRNPFFWLVCMLAVFSVMKNKMMSRANYG